MKALWTGILAALIIAIAAAFVLPIGDETSMARNSTSNVRL